jgi:LysM repeat protein
MIALPMVRNTGRLLAPIAIIAVAVGVYLIVHANVATHSATTIRSTSERHVHSSPHRSRAHTAKAGAKASYYVVRAGDTLSAIATRSGVSLTRIEALNPALTSPYSLHTGQRLRLRR